MGKKPASGSMQKQNKIAKPNANQELVAVNNESRELADWKMPRNGQTAMAMSRRSTTTTTTTTTTEHYFFKANHYSSDEEDDKGYLWRN